MIPRRTCMTRALALAGLAGLGTRAAVAQTTKATQAAVHYQDQPKDGKKCATCNFFIPPSGTASGAASAGTCKIVQGSISPMGWCDFYAPRPA